jgi:hypothetical protein
MSLTTDLAKARPKNSDKSRKMAAAPVATDRVSLGSGADAVGFGGLDNVAVWVNEGGAGGEVLR